MAALDAAGVPVEETDQPPAADAFAAADADADADAGPSSETRKKSGGVFGYLFGGAGSREEEEEVAAKPTDGEQAGRKRGRGRTARCQTLAS